MSNRINVAKWLEKYQRWQIKVRRDGERRTFTSPVPGRKGQLECQKKADDWLNRTIIDPQIRVHVLYDAWIEQLKINTSKSNWRNYDQYGRNYIKKAIGSKKVSSLSEQNLQDVLFYANRHPLKKQQLSEKTLKNILTCIKAFMKYARINGATSLHPENLQIPKAATKSNKQPLQPEDIQILFSSEKTLEKGKECLEWFVFAFRFAVVTGLRPGEIIGLQTKDIDMTNNVCMIHQAINSYGETTDGKNQNARRSFILPPIAVEALRDQLKLLRCAGIISEYVFPGRDGFHTNQQTYYKHWVRYRDYNGISKRTPYELRHTFFSANKSLPSQLVKQVGGHGKDFDTFGTYGHLMSGDMDTAASLIESAFQNILKRG